MRVLLLGASGFIGREIAACLQARGHRVVAAVRRPAAAARFNPEPAMQIDLNRDTSAETWIPRLAGIDAVVNCAGVLRGGGSQSIEAIHTRAPIALVEACERAGVRRFVQVSAISADRAAGTEYALTKLAADDRLRASSLDWVVLRPSLVIASGAFGGTAAMRAMAALPTAIFVPGEGGQRFQPVWIGDLARVVALALETDTLVRSTLDVVGPEVATLREILEDYRLWLGFGRAPVISIPTRIVRAAMRLGDLFGTTLNSTAYSQLEYGNTGDADAFRAATGIEAMGWKQMLARHPAHAQDRWQARLHFVRPLLRASLGLVWLVSGVAGLVALEPWARLFARELGMPFAVAAIALGAACLVDIAIAALLAIRWKPRNLALMQVAIIAGYTAVATALWPSLWLEALAPIAKNLPIAVAALALGAIEEER